MRAWLFSFDPASALRACSRGAVSAELFLEDTVAYSVVLEDGDVEAAGALETRGLSARAIDREGLVRFASSTGLSAEDAARTAAAVGGTGRPSARPPEGLEVYATALERPPSAISLEARVALAQVAHRAARDGTAHVRVFLRDSLRSISIAHSGGGYRGAALARALIGVEVIARDGARVEAAFESSGGEGSLLELTEARVTAVARLARARALALLAAPEAEAGQMPVILGSEAGGTFVHEAVGHPLEADLVLDGVSVFEDRVGSRIASPLLTVVDDPSLVGHNGSFPIDDEGTPAARTVLIEDGVLRRYLSDRRTGLLLGQATTGNARRESFRCRPIVRMSNTLILPGPHDPREILADTPRGLYVARMGGGEVDTVTGHFVFEAAEAYRIEGGQLGPLVRGATLTGDTESVLKSIDRVGHDLGFGIGTCGKEAQDVPITDGEPTIRIPALVVGGRTA